MGARIAGGPTTRQPSGEQYSIAHGDHHARIVQVGAAVREYRVGDRDVLQRVEPDEVSWDYHGVVLTPWPNRIAGGRYDFDGVSYQLPLTEPERDAALHGLGAWAPWQLVDREPHRVALRLSLLPSPGYPFCVDTTVEYSLSAAGLTVRTTAVNSGDRACPFGLGFHPYAAAAPDSTLDDCTLQLGVSRHLVPDEKLIPVRDEQVAGEPCDFRSPRSLAGVSLDDGFGGALPDVEGRSWARLRGSDSHTVAIWADSSFGYWQVYTGDRLPQPRTRRGAAIEPMTAAPNAFRSGDGLIRLEPGESLAAEWGVTLE